jgi:hypothetical protein
MSAGPVVGRSTNSGKSTQVVTQAPNASGDANKDDLIDEVLGKIELSTGLNLRGTLQGNPGLIENLSPSELAAIGKLLKKMGVRVLASNESIRTTLNGDETFRAMAQKLGPSANFAQLYQAIANDYNPALDGSKKEKEYLPTRSLTDVTDEQIGKIIDSASLATIGRVLPKKQRDAEIAKNRKLADQGTFTTSKKIKDPKTGKDVVVTKSNTPFTAEKATLDLNESLKTSNPKQYELNKSLEFQDEFTKILSGGI